MASKKSETHIQLTKEEALRAATESGMSLGKYKRKYHIDIVAETPPIRPSLDLTVGMQLIRDHSESSRHTG